LFSGLKEPLKSLSETVILLSFLSISEHIFSKILESDIYGLILR
jgi:hypothetical protein